MFESFFLAGFECATGYNARGEWIDQIAATHHDLLVDEDYERLRRHGILGVREGIRWPLVDRGGRYDFSTVEPVVAAARRHRIRVIFDLFHFGYPEGADPFADEFAERFAEYCYACARFVSDRLPESCVFTPVNEPSYFAWAAGEAGRFAPHATGRGPELKLRLCRAAIAGIDAIRAACPHARIVNVDPICRVVAPPGDPEKEAAAACFNGGAVFEAFDMIGGRLHPELGGSPAHLDVVGINYYWTNQWEIGGACTPLAEDDPRCAPLRDLVRAAWERYGHEIVITETAHAEDRRAPWIETLAEEVAALIDEGVPLLGACLYPVLGMPEWHDQRVWTRMGLWDLEPADGLLERRPHRAALAALRRAQRRLEPLAGGRLARYALASD